VQMSSWLIGFAAAKERETTETEQP